VTADDLGASDPLEGKPDKSSQDIVAVFVDIEDSTGIANHYGSAEYRDFLSVFHKCVHDVVAGDDWAPIRSPGYHNFFGDEFMAFLPASDYGSAVGQALDLACALKMSWYVSSVNRERLDSDKEIIELNVGINLGRVHRMPYPLSADDTHRPFTLEGFPITIAKRAQSACEDGRASRIVLADRAYREYVKRSQRNHDFSYMGRRQLKGLTQTLSVYEWLGDEFEEPPDDLRDDLQNVLQSLYQKNPLNPWYALLLARSYYHRAEADWYAGQYDSPWYATTASLCLTALQTINWSKLRTITAVLLTCLEVQRQWLELGFRAEQAFVNDPTFAYALGLRAKALLGLYIDEEREGKHFLDEAQREARRAITLFERHDEDINHEALFLAHMINAGALAVEDRETRALDAFANAVRHAESGDIKWAAEEVASIQPAMFSKLTKSESWKDMLARLERVRVSE